MSVSPVTQPAVRGPTKNTVSPAPHVLHDADGFIMATWRNVAIHVWTIQATPALVAKLDELSTAFIGTHPEGISAVHIISKNAPLPDKVVREKLRQVSERHSKHVACVCHVVEGSGFWASALQSFLTGLRWLSQRSFSLHICSDIGAAAQWLPTQHAQRTNAAIAQAELEAALRAVRRRAG